MRRLLLVLIALSSLTACNGANMNDNDPDDKPMPTARSEAGGIEVWDLTGAPSAEAFGIPDDKAAGIYETQQPRTVRFVLPDGVELTVESTLVTFERFGEGDDARYTFGIRTAQLEPDALVSTYRDVLGQLQVPTDVADKLAAEIAGAPKDQTEHIIVGSAEASSGDLKIGAQADIAPIAGSGPVIIGGSWQKG